MKLAVSVVRVFGTNDQYGAEPRLRPAGVPLTYTGFPTADWSASVDFGPVPDEVIEAERGRRAIGCEMLHGLFGAVDAPGGAPAERVAAAYDEIDPAELFGDFNWYVTLAVTRTFDVAEDSLGPGEFAFTRDAFELESEALRVGREALDLLCAVVSTIVEPRLFRTLARDDRVLFYAEGRRPAGVPVITPGGIDLLVTAGEESVAKLGRRLSVLGAVDLRVATQEAWLTRISHWRVQVLTETDPWKRFLWSAVGLEILTQKLYERFREQIVQRLRLEGSEGIIESPLPIPELVWADDRTPLLARFAYVAMALFPQSATADTDRFRTVKRARDRLAHGSLREEDELPLSEVVDLFEKYLAGALKRVSFGHDATVPWEDIAS